MKKILSIMIFFSIMLNIAGCHFESKELKQIKSISTSYAYTKEDSKILKEKKNDKEVQRWLEDVAKKIQNKEYSSTEISALMSYLESADVQHVEIDKQVKAFYADIMKKEKEKAFATSDPVSVIEYAEKVEKMIKKVPAGETETYLPYSELAKYIRDNFTLTISKSNAGGYYDEKSNNSQNNYVIEEGSASELTLKKSKYYYFDFSGDFMLRGFEKKNYRHTDEEWEEEILKPLDYESLTVYYKDVEVNLGKETFSELSESDVYVYPDGESYIVFIIQENKILARGKNIGFNMEYNSK